MSREATPPLANLAVFINYGFDHVRFVTPVPADARVRGHFTLRDVERKGDTRALLRYGVNVEIEQHTQPALVAEWLGMAVYTGPQPRDG